MVRFPIGLVLLAGALVSANAVLFTAPQRRAGPARVDPAAIDAGINEVLKAYAEGDDLAVEGWLRTPEAGWSLSSIDRVVAQPVVPWSRARAAFLLEVAVGTMTPRDGQLGARDLAMGLMLTRRTDSLLLVGANLVARRPAPLGADPVKDRFEVLWHQAALGVAQGIEQYTLQYRYVESIAPRFDQARSRGVTLPTRLPLARAIAGAGLCCSGRPMPGDQIQIRLINAPPPPVTADNAIAFFERAAAVPELYTEALIRGAVLLARIGREPEALAWFQRVPPHTDRGLGYMHHLTLARLLDEVNRPGDAANAYGVALDHAPANQRAAIGYAAALLRAGRDEEAGVAAANARRMPEERGDPARAYLRADARFVREWLAEIRRLRR
jgi:hypothetical protein